MHLHTFLLLLAFMAAVISHQPQLVRCREIRPEVPSSDMWNMVASMRAPSAPPTTARRVEATSTPFSRSLELDWSLELDAAGHFKLSWSANLEQNELLMALEITANKSQFRPGTDLFALGFSERGELASSDFCLVWYDLSHRMHLQAARTSINNTLQLLHGSLCEPLNHHRSRRPDPSDSPMASATNDYEDDDTKLDHETSSKDGQRSEDEQKLEIIFKRPLEPCDEREHFYNIDNGTTHLVWFALRGPLLELDGLNLTEGLEQQRKWPGELSGLRRVQMIASKQERSATNRHERSHEIRMDKYQVPGQETTYMCKLFKLPARFSTRRHHITRYEALVDAGNEHVVHHMELFNCAHVNESERGQLEELLGWTGECGASERPPVSQKCKRVILAWAMGARPFVYPQQVGQPIGGPDYSPYVMLEVHYNNVARQKDLVDSSGLRFGYSGRLRANDAAVLEVGLEYTDKNSIPPRLVAPLAGHCHSECTRAAMSAGAQTARGLDGTKLAEGIYIFAAQMHTHLTGVASWTEHVRAGRLLGELQRDQHYSPHFQEIRMLPAPVRLAPGDALIHHCLYDTRQRANMTLGGHATRDEMCVTYLHYYPRIDLEVCKSSVETRALSHYFERLARDELQATTQLELLNETIDVGKGGVVPLKSVAENYHSIEWSARRSRELLQFYHEAPLSIQCNRSDGSRWPGYWEGLAPTRFTQVDAQFRQQTRQTNDDQDEDEDKDAATAILEYRGLGARRKRPASCQLQSSRQIR